MTLWILGWILGGVAFAGVMVLLWHELRTASVRTVHETEVTVESLDDDEWVATCQCGASLVVHAHGPVKDAAARIKAANIPALTHAAEVVLDALVALAEYADAQSHTTIREPITQGQRTIPRSH